jgi:CheY-like chemotaxis protein
MKSDLVEPVTTSTDLSVEYRILVVDDYEGNWHMLRILLQRKGITVFEVENGYEALEIACQQHPDGILMDLSMPIRMASKQHADSKKPKSLEAFQA